MPKKVDIILPVYNEEAGIELFASALFRAINPLRGSYEFQVIYVLDRSTDRSFPILKHLAEGNTSITVIHLSRRFGHQMSLVAGMDHSTADAVIMMDSDLQHPPELIPELLARFEEGFEIVHTVRSYARDVPWIKRALSTAFYRIQNAMSPIELREGGADFRLISRKVAAVFQTNIRERDQFLRGLFQWVGFRNTTVNFVSSPRVAGRTKYSFTRLLSFSITGVLAFSKLPLRTASILGALFSGIGLLYGLYIVIVSVLEGNLPPGYTSLIAVVLLLGGLQLTVLGIIGEYLGTVFDEVKRRPLYIVDEVINGVAVAPPSTLRGPQNR